MNCAQVSFELSSLEVFAYNPLGREGAVESSSRDIIDYP